MHCVAFIPARMGSTRFPGKPLADIHGLPMLVHVALRTRLSQRLDDTVVATCDACIAEACSRYGIQSIMTSPAHERCSDRVAEAMLAYEHNTGRTVDIALMVQGDEPMVTPSMIDAALAPFAESTVRVVNLMAALPSVQAFEDPNEVKVVLDKAGNALYFSREPVPSRKKGASSVPMLKQVCVIPFRREALLQFTHLPEGELEKAESIDMLRFLEHGQPVRMVLVQEESLSVDTPDDLEKVRSLMQHDSLRLRYA
jgi:3-deoxy-manno-octulosonate cytidylyltransferase (CMP-KDO synthetase)